MGLNLTQGGDLVKHSRIDTVNQYIQKNKEVKISELEQVFPDVSGMTLRRDLALLEQRGDIIRIRGGARSIASLSLRMIKEEDYNLRVVENSELKQSVAEKALSFVEKGRSLYLDAGTTLMSFASVFPEQFPSFVLTSAPNIALELIRKQGVTVTLVGGQLSNENISISGANSIDFVKNINIDIAFMGTSGFSLDSGFTTGNFNECELKRYIIRKARRVIMLMDSSKLDQNMLFTFAHLKDIDVIVSDGNLAPGMVGACEKAKIQIV